MKVGIVDYDAGNLRSVETALDYLSFDHVVSNDVERLVVCDVLIVPGVGEASSAMRTLRERGLDQVILSHAKAGKRLIGICLGCQVFVEHSDEGDTDCLGLLRGRVVRFPAVARMKVPHMGWNQVRYVADTTLFHGIPDGRSFYFVHSYYVDPDTAPDTVGTTEYSARFAAALASENVVAFQFHPEKSGPYGLRLLENTIRGNDA